MFDKSCPCNELDMSSTEKGMLHQSSPYFGNFVHVCD